jgi:hypothetical protein
MPDHVRHDGTISGRFITLNPEPCTLISYVPRFVLHPRRYCSNANMRFQSFFMLMTVHPCFFAWSHSAWVNVPMYDSVS